MAAGVVRCSAGIVDWIVEEVVSMDRKTRKILATKLAVNTPGIMFPDYVYRGRKGKGLIGIEECVKRRANPCMATSEIA